MVDRRTMSLRATPSAPPLGEVHPKPNERPWLGVRFTCSGSYVRVYRDRTQPVYLARCPRCARCIRFRVGEGGTDQRFFNVSCS